MDITAIVAVLIPALSALGLIGAYLSRESRKDRAEKRKLRRLVLDMDEWHFQQQRKAARKGFTLDPLPKSWEALHDPDDQDGPAPDRPADPEGASRSSRHALRE